MGKIGLTLKVKVAAFGNDDHELLFSDGLHLKLPGSVHYDRLSNIVHKMVQAFGVTSISVDDGLVGGAVTRQLKERQKYAALEDDVVIESATVFELFFPGKDDSSGAIIRLEKRPGEDVFDVLAGSPNSALRSTGHATKGTLLAMRDLVNGALGRLA